MGKVMPLSRQPGKPISSIYVVQNITLIPSPAYVFPE
jgi:hypothetical protein